MSSVRRIVERRFDMRMAVDIGVSLRDYDGWVQRLTISDLTVAGAMIVGDFGGLARGDEVILTVGDAISVVATIKWITGGRCGAEFHRRLDNAQFDAMLDCQTRLPLAPREWHMIGD